jgi:MFS transporter, DHA1 family, multidrug resistance protein
MADRAAPAETTGTGRGPGMREFVILMAALMASNALAIDAMLPALPAIGEALDVADENRRQLITAYLIGFGLAQLVYGPVSDRVGRKPILVVTLLLYAAFALLCGIASSFNLLLAARFLQGVAAAGTRVLVVSIIRDRFAGERMAKVMSLVFIIFMVVPVLAPAFGTIVLAVATWRAIFIGLAVYGAVVLAWSWLRLPETLHPEHRRALSTAAIGEAALLTLTNRQSIGNTVASTLIFGGLFACIAGPMAFSSWMNSRLVERIGARRLALGAMVTFTIVSATHLALALALTESLALFVVMQALTMMTFGLIGANLGSIAMAPLGHIAGTASSVQGLIGTVGGADQRAAVGQAFDGTQIPFLIGLVLCGISALAVAIYANPPLAQGGKDIAGT